MMKTFKKQIASIRTENDLKDAHIAICQACSANQISWEHFMALRRQLKAKRTEKGFTWGKGIYGGNDNDRKTAKASQKPAPAR